MNISKSFLVLSSLLLYITLSVGAQTDTPKLYNPQQDVKKDIKNAIAKARAEGKHVLLQVGGNW